MKNFLDFMCKTNKKLTNNQKECAKYFFDFLDDTAHIFILKGSYHTGKTYLSNLLNKYLNEYLKDFFTSSILFPTNIASKENSKKTIHSSIYEWGGGREIITISSY